MEKRLVAIFEILISMTLFALFTGMVITNQSNKAIVEHTEEFVELVRYKGCITSQMYEDFIDGFQIPVDVRIQVSRQPVVTGAGIGELSNLQFTEDVVSTIESTPDHTYPMNVGDEVQVVVRRPGRSMYSTILSALGGSRAKGDTNPVVAIKGGMILNEQYH